MAEPAGLPLGVPGSEREEASLPCAQQQESEQLESNPEPLRREAQSGTNHPAAGVARYVRLNVGGTRYTTLLETLTRVPGSMLTAMFGGLSTDEHCSFNLPQDDTGAYIIDRDGQSFRHVLNFLRHDGPTQCSLPRSAEDRSMLAREAEYYMLDELFDQCCSIGHNGRQLYPMSQAEFLSQPLRDSSANGNPVKVVFLPPVDLRAINLAYQSYVGCAFRECDLRQVDMRKANLSCCDLQDARLQGSDLSAAVLSHARLKGANLEHALLSNANLQYCDLEGASLRFAILDGANLGAAQLQGADLRGAVLLRLQGASSNQGTNWAGVLLDGARVDDATYTALAGIRATQRNPQYKNLMRGAAQISLEGLVVTTPTIPVAKAQLQSRTGDMDNSGAEAVASNPTGAMRQTGRDTSNNRPTVTDGHQRVAGSRGTRGGHRRSSADEAVLAGTRERRRPPS